MVRIRLNCPWIGPNRPDPGKIKGPLRGSWWRRITLPHNHHLFLQLKADLARSRNSRKLEDIPHLPTSTVRSCPCLHFMSKKDRFYFRTELSRWRVLPQQSTPRTLESLNFIVTSQCGYGCEGTAIQRDINQLFELGDARRITKDQEIHRHETVLLEVQEILYQSWSLHRKMPTYC